MILIKCTYDHPGSLIAVKLYRLLVHTARAIKMVISSQLKGSDFVQIFISSHAKGRRFKQICPLLSAKGRRFRQMCPPVSAKGTGFSQTQPSSHCPKTLLLLAESLFLDEFANGVTSITEQYFSTLIFINLPRHSSGMGTPGT